MEVSDREEKDDSAADADDYLEPDANPDDYLEPNDFEADYDNRLTLANEIVSAYGARSQFATSSNATPLYDNNGSAMAFVRTSRGPLPATHTYDNKF